MWNTVLSEKRRAVRAVSLLMGDGAVIKVIWNRIIATSCRRAADPLWPTLCVRDVGPFEE